MKNIKNTNSLLNTQALLSMRDSGYYSERTAGAKISIDSTQLLMEKAIKEIPKKPILKMADFGCADGGTSQEMWCNLIQKIRNIKDERQIEILYTDLASNDFSTLFKSMQGMQGDPKFSLQKLFTNVFVHGCGTGFHQQLMSNESLSLGFSATAMHYVSEKPCQIKNHVHMVGASKKEKNKFKEQAAKDWEAILLARSKELISGGRFICLNFGIDEEGRHLGNTNGHSMFDRFSYHWKSLENIGIITNAEFQEASFSQHYRTVEEFCQPFNDKSSLVCESGLRLISCNTQLTECPYKKNYINKKNSIPSSVFANKLISTMRSWSETVFRTALLNREDKEANMIIDKFYKLYEEEISSNPYDHSMDYVHILMDIEKI